MARASKTTRQLTLHFNGDEEVAILDQIKKDAKRDFRTPEQHALYLLSSHHFLVPLRQPKVADFLQASSEPDNPVKEVQ